MSQPPHIEKGLILCILVIRHFLYFKNGHFKYFLNSYVQWGFFKNLIVRVLISNAVVSSQLTAVSITKMVADGLINF